ncbi:SDR family oxidoreductase [Ligilactobacillus pobuzihii]|uniref:SDR family oxidoreductase n=1 Tax=Ligilactobacillus pobuzihii TaxID=449659 RepID=UPI001EC59691|nr:SDR family oxidoreductase [Ligilactobacillus pobuzihii]
MDVSCAKASSETSVKHLSQELGKRGIRINVVFAGPIKTLTLTSIHHYRKMLKNVCISYLR